MYMYMYIRTLPLAQPELIQCTCTLDTLVYQGGTCTCTHMECTDTMYIRYIGLPRRYIVHVHVHTWNVEYKFMNTNYHN